MLYKKAEGSALCPTKDDKKGKKQKMKIKTRY